MDPVTHAASGAVAMLCLPSRPVTKWALPLAALLCASPDIDVFFSSSPLGFLEFHRGITHALAAAPLFALLLALCAYPLWRSSTPGRWSFSGVWFFCICMVLLHDWLDVVTSYGTLLFLPFSHYRVRLNGIFIIDILVTLPLLLALWRPRRRTVLLVLAWTFVYPALGVAINQWHLHQWQTTERGIPAHPLPDAPEAHFKTGDRVYVYPDAFAPFFWRVVYLQDGLVRDQSIDALGRPRSTASTYRPADASMVWQIATSSTDGEVYFAFSQLPVMRPALPGELPDDMPPGAQVYLFHDLRFGSGLDFVRRIMAMRPHADLPFKLYAEFLPQPDSVRLSLTRIRLRFSDSGRDSHWHKPIPPRRPSLPQWLVGMN